MLNLILNKDTIDQDDNGVASLNELYILSSKKRTYNVLKKHFGNICWYCGISLENNQLINNKKGHIEHIIARKNHGKHRLSNLALACPMCNYAKHIMTLGNFLTWLVHLRSDDFKCSIFNVQNKTDLICLKDQLQKVTYCSNCNIELNTYLNFCPYCGYQVDSEALFCTLCKQRVEASWQFCKHCGTNLKQVEIIKR